MAKKPLKREIASEKGKDWILREGGGNSDPPIQLIGLEANRDAILGPRSADR